jgi:murein L,D-transpeptidase YcbB/YkuD
MPFFKKLLIIVLVICTVYSCKTKVHKEPAPIVDETISGRFSPPTKKVFDSNAIARFVDSFPKLSVIAKEIHSFYRRRNYSYAWFDEKGMIEQAAHLYNKIKDITDEGISKNKMPYQQELSGLMENQSGQFQDTSSLFTELMLTSQYLLYAKNVWQGLDEKETIGLQWLLPRKNISYSQTLDSLLSGKDILANPPVYRQYYLLKEYLQKYRKAESADTIIIPANAVSIAIGDSSPVVSNIRSKLFLLGDLQENSANTVYDEELMLSVKKFQKRVGTKITGVLSKEDLVELNVPIHKRIEQILVNMERSRWVTKNPPSNHFIVNIPEFKLYALENDSVVWNMNVVVGQNQHKTVVFNGDIRYVVFAPYWNIPASILKNETLPALRRNKNYLATHNMEWNNGSVRQKPGPNNALGLVKFLFPNSHSIYLHDSPAKSLFNETNRAFSHGCIRVAEAKKLAIYLLRNDTSWNEQKITAAMNGGREKYVTLKHPVPVFIAYFTSWVSRDGELNFRKDIYERDNRLLEMLIN